MAKKPVWTHEDEIDFDGIYICPMVRKDSFDIRRAIREGNCEEVVELAECKIERYQYGGGYNIVPISDEYHQKFFYDNYLAFLLYTKYIYKK